MFVRGQTPVVRSLAVLGVALLAGCATPAAGPPVQSRPSQELASLRSVAADLATRTGQWPEQQQVIDRALSRTTNDCMRAQGLPAPTDPPAVHPWTEAGLVDMPSRKAYGYRLATSGPEDGTGGPDAPRLARMTAPARARYLEALLGESGPALVVRLPDGREIRTPKSGCVAKGRSAVFGSIQNWATVTYVPESLGDVVTAKVPQTPEYRSALAGWRSCMQRAGYSTDSPESLVARIRDLYVTGGDRPQTRALEIRTAVADGTCGLESHLSAAATRARRHLLDTGLTNEQHQLMTDAATLWLKAVRASTSS